MKEEMRRYICTVLAAVLTAGLLAGCASSSGSQNGQESSEQTVRISMYNDIAYSDWRTYVEQQFPDVTFIWENNRNSTQNLIYQARHDDLADIVMIRRFENDSAGELAPYLMDLGGEELASTFIDDSLTPFTFDGKVCWFPAPAMVEAIYANATLFDRCGIKVPQTLDEFEEACREFRNRGIEGLSVEASLGFRAVLLLEAFNYTGWFSSEEGQKWLNSFRNDNVNEIPEEGCRQLAETLRNLKECGALGEEDMKVDTAEAYSRFDSEKAAMFISGSDLQFNVKTDGSVRIIPCLGKTESDRTLFAYPIFSTAVSKRAEDDPARKALIGKILKVMYSGDAQRILAESADALFSYNKDTDLPVSDLYKPVSDLFRSGKCFMRFLNRNSFSASAVAVKDIVADDTSDAVFCSDLNAELGKTARQNSDRPQQCGGGQPARRYVAARTFRSIRAVPDREGSHGRGTLF
jgi:ABC-type glycerol-3-phosphate transport system substrate-binding protein